MNYVTLLKQVFAAVKVAEQLIPGTGQGTTKLDMVKTMLEEFATAGGMATDWFQANWPAIQSLIALSVSMYNAAGLFKTKP
jgi:hypothetical protein